MKKKIIMLIATLITAILYIWFVINIKNLNLLPNRYFFLIIAAPLLIYLLIGISTLAKKKWLKIICLIIYILTTSTLIVGIYITQNTVNFFDNSFANNTYETTAYNVYVQKNKYSNIKDLKGKNISYLNIDSQYQKSLNTLHKKIDFSPIEFDNLIDAYESLNENSDALILDTGYITILEEVYPDLNEQIESIYSFEIKKTIENNYTQKDDLEPINIYISGSDSRDNELYNKSRSDFNLILTINPKTKTVLMTSIPRDYYIPLANKSGKYDKLTHSGIYGLDTTIQTVENLFDITIDYSIKVNFNSVITIVDLVDGVDIYSDKSFTTHCGDGGAEVTNVVKGMNHFNGAQALSYVRERYAYNDGDRHRILNGQQVLKAVLEKVMTNKSLLLKYNQILKSINELYVTDIPSSYIKKLIKNQLNDMTSWTFESNSVNGTGDKKETYSMPNTKTYVMIPNYEDVSNATRELNNILSE